MTTITIMVERFTTWEHGEGEYDASQFLEGDLPTGELVFISNPMGELTLTYKFDIYALEPMSRNYVFVDAHSGDIVDTHTRIHDIDVPATGTSLYNGTVSFTADDTGTEFRLRKDNGGVNGVETYDLNNGTSYGAATDITHPTADFTDPDDSIGVSAHWGAEQTLEYFFTTFGRNSYDDAGTALLSYVSYGNNFVNAFWMDRA